MIYEAARDFEGQGRGIHSLRYFFAKVLERWTAELATEVGRMPAGRSRRGRASHRSTYVMRPGDQARDNSLKTHPDVKRTIDEHRARLGPGFGVWWERTVEEAKRKGRWPSVYAYDLIRAELKESTRRSEGVANA